MSLQKLVAWWWFDNFILFVIVLSSVALAIGNPYNNQTTITILVVGDYCWLVTYHHGPHADCSLPCLPCR